VDDAGTGLTQGAGAGSTTDISNAVLRHNQVPYPRAHKHHVKETFWLIR